MADLPAEAVSRAGGYAVWLPRDVLEVAGPEAEVFLQGQLSQDVEGMVTGDSRWSWVLSPAGKVDALVRVTRVPVIHSTGEKWILDTDGGFGEALQARLARFKLRTKVEFTALPWKVLAIRGTETALHPRKGELIVDAGWEGMAAVDVLGPDPVAPEGFPIADLDVYEWDRISEGFPRMGHELTERTIPAETGLMATTVSFTKGCYTGQELVARIDTRGGHVARHLRLLLPPPGKPSAGPGPGTELHTAGPDAKVVGEITSAAARPSGGWIALGYVHRSITPPAELFTTPDDTRVDVRDLRR